MTKLSRAVGLAAFCFIVAGSAGAATVKCNSGQTNNATIGKLKPATGYVTINVSGACSDDIYVPSDLAVDLIGANGTALVPAVRDTRARRGIRKEEFFFEKKNQKTFTLEERQAIDAPRVST